ncbi:MFS transporter [Sporolactobacillus shoreicorticis]|uniref:Putative proline/betaine transporter n=1 Tax=Sporolactobacillus shoreicorticis TaxID=1923877 RepID=A0ABW5S4Q6_9BACL|nr:MFS transporter [Sporolactobacillus shoreicorticis]MCO7124290.1 MFS transporter [Sporolactobacillus shoreicorticis]
MMTTVVSVSKKKVVKAVAAASVGNALEWYDFSVYAFFAIYISQNFFPEGNSSVQLISAFLIFGVGFIIRPLGAIILGNYGDRNGRKALLTLTIIMMAAGVLVIGLAPSYYAIGFGAPILILVGRVLQGFSAGGEMGGASAFLVEYADEENKGKYAAWLQASMAVSNILGALVATIVTLSFTQQQVASWGWRIPFLLGVLIAPVGLYLRNKLDETPQFIAERKKEKDDLTRETIPLLKALSKYPKELILGISFSVLWVVSVYTLIIFMPTYEQKTLHFSSSESFTASLVANVCMFIGCLLSGLYSDKIGRQKMLLFSTGLLFVGVYPMLLFVQSVHSFFVLVITQTVFCLLVSLFVGVAPSALSEIFPTEVRATGISLTYNLPNALLGGFAPAILTLFTEVFHNTFAPAWYVMICAAVSFIAILFMPHYRKTFTVIKSHAF